MEDAILPQVSLIMKTLGFAFFSIVIISGMRKLARLGVSVGTDILAVNLSLAVACLAYASDFVPYVKSLALREHFYWMMMSSLMFALVAIIVNIFLVEQKSWDHFRATGNTSIAGWRPAVGYALAAALSIGNLLFFMGDFQ